MKFRSHIIKRSLITALLINILIPIYSQCDFYGSISVSASGFENGAGYTQEYVLVNDNSDIILAINSTGTFSSLTNINYRVYAVNYKNSRPTELAVSNTWASVVANASSYCFDYIGPYSGSAVTVCDQICFGTDISVSTSGHTTGGSFEQKYVVVNPAGNIVVTNTSGTFSGLTVGDYNLYAVNTDDAALKTEINNLGAWSDVVGCPSGTCCNIIGPKSFNIYDCSGSLPISLIEFNCKLKSNIVELKWITTNEKNNNLFTIERSKDGIDFISINYTKGAGTSNSIIEYSEVDENPYSGISYYRLKQTDFDGNSTYSKIETINRNENSNIQINIFPNPANDILNISYSQKNAQPFSYVISDLSGRKVINGNINNIDEKYIYKLNLDELTRGYYLIQILSGSNSFYFNFIKE
ncbi:MAG: hypothetical protein A2033_15660 [Bacteroidetes bacterium GWA2_31_9]|nr:MAG: hypothetical protein A2033_15660 [Bacteroidetes bacterium GWA2_31_9]